jgi:hypothetical protein
LLFGFSLGALKARATHVSKTSHIDKRIQFSNDAKAKIKARTWNIIGTKVLVGSRLKLPHSFCF